MSATDHENVERLAYTFEEFGLKFGKHRSWVYRQVAARKIKAITGYGVAMIPASELARILQPEGAADERGED
jgi:hypothetical protein